MKKSEKNEELQSRREFFKKGMKEPIEEAIEEDDQEEKAECEQTEDSKTK